MYLTKYYSNPGGSEYFKYRSTEANSYIEKYNTIASVAGFKNIAINNCTYETEEKNKKYIIGKISCALISNNDIELSCNLFILVTEILGSKKTNDILYDKNSNTVTINGEDNEYQKMLGLFTPVVTERTIIVDGGTQTIQEYSKAPPSVTISYDKFKTSISNLVDKIKELSRGDENKCSSCNDILLLSK